MPNRQSKAATHRFTGAENDYYAAACGVLSKRRTRREKEGRSRGSPPGDSVDAKSISPRLANT
jgi:hypothetical protein